MLKFHYLSPLIMKGDIVMRFVDRVTQFPDPMALAASRAILDDLLRERMGFEGLIAADSPGMKRFTFAMVSRKLRRWLYVALIYLDFETELPPLFPSGYGLTEY